MEHAILVLIAVVLGGAVAGGLATTWSLHRRVYRLENALMDTQQVVTREVKRRAADGRWSKQADLEQELQALQKAPKQERFVNEFFGE